MEENNQNLYHSSLDIIHIMQGASVKFIPNLLLLGHGSSLFLCAKVGQHKGEGRRGRAG